MDAHFLQRLWRAICRCAWACWTSGIAISALLQPLHCAHSHGLRRLTAYLQQLEMESNGKSISKNGIRLTAHGTGDLGRARHQWAACFFQMLHQGPDVIPVEFIALRDGGKYLGEHHQSLVVNAIAQAQALMVGRCERSGKRLSRQSPQQFLMLKAWIPPLWAPRLRCMNIAFLSLAPSGTSTASTSGVWSWARIWQLHARQSHNDWAGVDASTQELMKRLMQGH
jgi:glucose-6-phosphate isomerase